jgi:hypothetical protein
LHVLGDSAEFAQERSEIAASRFFTRQRCRSAKFLHCAGEIVGHNQAP